MGSLALSPHQLLELLLEVDIAHRGLCAIVVLIVLGSLDRLNVLGQLNAYSSCASMEAHIPSELDITADGPLSGSRDKASELDDTLISFWDRLRGSERKAIT